MGIYPLAFYKLLREHENFRIFLIEVWTLKKYRSKCTVKVHLLFSFHKVFFTEIFNFELYYSSAHFKKNFYDLSYALIEFWPWAILVIYNFYSSNKSINKFINKSIFNWCVFTDFFVIKSSCSNLFILHQQKTKFVHIMTVLCLQASFMDFQA